MKDKLPEFVRQLAIFAVISRIGIVIQETLETMTNSPRSKGYLLHECIIIVTNVPDHRMVGGRGRVPSQVSRGYHHLAPSHPLCLSWITFLGLCSPL